MTNEFRVQFQDGAILDPKKVAKTIETLSKEVSKGKMTGILREGGKTIGYWTFSRRVKK